MHTTVTRSFNNQTHPYPVSVLIVAKADPTRDSLRLLLETRHWINVVAQTDDYANVMEMVNRHRPTLVILDTNVSADSLDWIAILEQIRAETLQTSCLILTNTVRKQQMVQESGTHSTLIKGYPAEKLFEAITELTLMS